MSPADFLEPLFPSPSDDHLISALMKCLCKPLSNARCSAGNENRIAAHLHKKDLRIILSKQTGLPDRGLFVTLTSPIALKLLNNNDGIVRGKAALREYFVRGLQNYPELRFDLIDVLWGLETLVVYYHNNVSGRKAAEVMQLTAKGEIWRVWAHYDQ